MNHTPGHNDWETLEARHEPLTESFGVVFPNGVSCPCKWCMPRRQTKLEQMQAAQLHIETVEKAAPQMLTVLEALRDDRPKIELEARLWVQILDAIEAATQ